MAREKSRSPSKHRPSSGKQRPSTSGGGDGKTGGKSGTGGKSSKPGYKRSARPARHPTNPCNPYCCLPLSEGCIFVGIWTLLFAIIELSLFGWQTALVESKRERLASVANPFGSYDRDWPDRNVNFYKSPEIYFYNTIFAIQIVHMVLDFFVLATSVMLIWGFHCHVKWLIWPWFFALAANIICTLAYCVIWFAEGGNNRKKLPVGMIIAQILFVIVNIYCIIVAFMGFRALRAGILKGKKYLLSPGRANEDYSAGNRQARQIVIDYGDQVRPYENRVQTAVPDKTYFYDQDGNMYTNGAFTGDGGDQHGTSPVKDRMGFEQQMRPPLDPSIHQQAADFQVSSGGGGAGDYNLNNHLQHPPSGAGAPPNYETTFPAERGESLAPSVDLNNLTGDVNYGKYDRELLIPPGDFIPKIPLDLLDSPVEKKDPNFGHSDFPVAEFIHSKDKDHKQSGAESGYDDGGNKKDKRHRKSKSREKSKSHKQDNEKSDKDPRRSGSHSRKERERDKDRRGGGGRHRSQSETRSKKYGRSHSRKHDDDRDSRDDYHDRHRSRGTASNDRDRARRRRRSSDYDERSSPDRSRHRSRNRRDDHRSFSRDRHGGDSRSHSRDRDQNAARPVPYVTGPSSAEELDQIGRQSAPNRAPPPTAYRNNNIPGSTGVGGAAGVETMSTQPPGFNSIQLPQTIIFPAVSSGNNDGAPLSRPRNIMINSEIKISMKPKSEGGWEVAPSQRTGHQSQVQSSEQREGGQSRMTPGS